MSTDHGQFSGPLDLAVELLLQQCIGKQQNNRGGKYNIVYTDDDDDDNDYYYQQYFLKCHDMMTK